MDIARPEAKRQKRIRRTIYIAVAVVLIPLVTYALSKLKPAAPSVDRATVWTDTVKRGPMLREVRGLGTLVPVNNPPDSRHHRRHRRDPLSVARHARQSRHGNSRHAQPGTTADSA